MKKITLLFLLTSISLFAQQPQTYTETQSINIAESNEDAIITRVENNRLPIIDTYINIDDFNTALTENCSDTTLTSEDFSGGPTNITSCGTIVSDAGDGCFAAGELESGFNVQASNGTEVVNIPPAAIGNVDSLVGATTFLEYTIINFSPNVYAVALDLWENNDPLTTVRIYGDGGVLMETLNVVIPVNSQTFFGLISDEPISIIELEGQNESGELFGNFLYGASCFLSTDDQILSNLSIYPNPTSNHITINTPAGVVLESTAVFNLLGKVVSENNQSNRLDLSHLSNGVYFVKINTEQGTTTKKIIKK